MNATYAELTDLTELLSAMAGRGNDEDLGELVRLNWRFHRKINEIARGPRILAVIRTVAMSVPRNYLLDFPDDAANLVAEKERVLDAMKEREVDGAEMLMRQHVLDGGSNLIAYFVKRGLLTKAAAAGRQRTASRSTWIVEPQQLDHLYTGIAIVPNGTDVPVTRKPDDRHRRLRREG